MMQLFINFFTLFFYNCEKRIVKRGGEHKAFYLLEQPTKYYSRTVAVSQTDMPDLFDVIITLRGDTKVDTSTTSDYKKKYCISYYESFNYVI